jgi:hypothetical protein
MNVIYCGELGNVITGSMYSFTLQRKIEKVFIGKNKKGARWSSGQCARRAIAEAKHRSQWPDIGWVTKIYYLELLRASEGTLSR